jgi:hypothetical protein
MHTTNLSTAQRSCCMMKATAHTDVGALDKQIATIVVTATIQLRDFHSLAFELELRSCQGSTMHQAVQALAQGVEQVSCTALL